MGAFASAQVSPFNGLEVRPPDSTGAYRLLIGGHFHGASSNTSGFPAATLLARLGTINGTRANVLLSTGDLFLSPDRDSARFADAFFSKLEIPLFNAPGNHDLEGKAYEAGRRMPVLIPMGDDRIVLFDTERDDSRLKGDQLDLLAGLADTMDTGRIRRLFIVSHRPVWAEEDDRFAPLFEGNTRSLLGSNFRKEVLPLLQRMARTSDVYWISGSMAGGAPASIFFQPDGTNITYVQCAIRDRLQDALLIADVTPHGIEWAGLSLTGLPMEAVETYDAQWWKARQGVKEPFHWRRIPYLVRKNLSYPSFWYGCCTAGILALGLWWVLRRRKQGP